MIIDISDILSCENKEETKQVQIELASFISKLGEFPIISAKTDRTAYRKPGEQAAFRLSR